ncbi:MAG: DUF2911 domain-containing protein [Flavobacteriaceae bacterium]|nr:MAG: DUF2911 domain-containing protein [Flavobacteriaceae bacterium]
MKKLALLICVVMGSVSLNGQITTPAPSPAAKISQTVGLTDVTVEYSRPSMRGRTIFGDLVPYDKLWRTGANKNSIITFSDDVTIAGQKVKSGSYAVYTKPGLTSWEVIFYADPNNWGTPQNWDDSKVAAKANIEVYTMPLDVESFTMSIDALHNNGATLGILWANVYIGVPFEVPTAEKAVKSIESVMNGPSANEYFAAASYYFQEGKDLAKAKEWIDKAVSMNDKAFWMMRSQSLIYAKMGDTKGAIAAAKKSMAVAEAAGNADYVKMNKDSLKEWGAL